MMLRLRSRILLRIPLLLLSLVAFVLACMLSAALSTNVAIAHEKVAVDEISQAVGGQKTSRSQSLNQSLATAW